MSEDLVHFLLVEDDDDHAALVERGLKRNRVQNRVSRVSDGAQAIQFLRKEGEFTDAIQPDTILLDLKLPKLNGHEVLEIIKADEDLRAIPVVMLTTSDAETDRVKAYQHHVNSYVVKPLDFTKFRELVEELNLYWGVWNRPPK